MAKNATSSNRCHEPFLLRGTFSMLIGASILNAAAISTFLSPVRAHRMITTIDALHKVLTPALMHHPVPETAQLPQIPVADRNLIRGQDSYFGIPSIATIASLDCRLFTE